MPLDHREQPGLSEQLGLLDQQVLPAIQGLRVTPDLQARPDQQEVLALTGPPAPQGRRGKFRMMYLPHLLTSNTL